MNIGAPSRTTRTRRDGDRFSRLAPLYLLHTARLKCAWCPRLKHLDPKDVPFLVTPDELRDAGYGQDGYSAKARRLIVKRLVEHFAAEHPDVRLPE